MKDLTLMQKIFGRYYFGLYFSTAIIAFVIIPSTVEIGTDCKAPTKFRTIKELSHGNDTMRVKVEKVK